MQYEHVIRHFTGHQYVCFHEFTVEAKPPHEEWMFSSDLNEEVYRSAIRYTAKLWCQSHGSSALAKFVVAVREDVETSDLSYYAAKHGEAFMMCLINIEEICKMQISLGANIEKVMAWRDLNRPQPWDLPGFESEC